jgi:hypothetical protein
MRQISSRPVRKMASCRELLHRPDCDCGTDWANVNTRYRMGIAVIPAR